MSHQLKHFHDKIPHGPKALEQKVGFTDNISLHHKVFSFESFTMLTLSLDIKFFHFLNL